MPGVGDGHDAVADGEALAQRALARIVLDAEEAAEGDAGLVDIVLVVGDEGVALGDELFGELVDRCGVVVVVGDGEQAGALVVPGRVLS